MEIDNTEIWAEVEITMTGVSVTLYSETDDGYCVVEDEAWFTTDEVLQSGHRDSILE